MNCDFLKAIEYMELEENQRSWDTLYKYIRTE